LAATLPSGGASLPWAEREAANKQDVRKSEKREEKRMAEDTTPNPRIVWKMLLARC
jgi:hypothetical protein